MQFSKKNRKIKVLILSHFGYPLYNKKCKKIFGGGAAVQLYLLSKEFAANKDLDVNILTGKYKPYINKIEIIDKIKLFKVLPLERKFLTYVKGFINFYIYLIRINPDIVIQRTAAVTTGLCAFYCRLFRKKFIFSIANKSDVNGDSEKGLLGKIFKFGLENASCIISQNHNQTLELKARKKKHINIILIKSGYEIKEIINENKEHILWVGRAVDWKRPEIFLKLAQKFPKEKFIMICYPENDINYYNSIVKNSEQIVNLNFLSYIPFHKVDKFFQDAKIFINTSTENEGFPNTFVQALKNRTPIISLDVDPDDILKNNKIGFVCNDNFDKMESIVRQILGNHELLQVYAKNCLKFAEKNYNIKEIGYIWIDLIKKFA